MLNMHMDVKQYAGLQSATTVSAIPLSLPL